MPTAAPSLPVPTVEVTAAPTPRPTIAFVKITPIPGAPDSGTVIALTARLVKWSVSSIDAPAGKIWHVRIDNQDTDSGGAHHNFVVASGPAFAERIFTSPLMNTGVYTFDIPGLPAGSYLFICTIHPVEMTGALILR